MHMAIGYTGFADEAAADIQGQVAATKRLGWSSIESRNVDGVNLTDVSDEKFEEVYRTVTEAGVRIDCFGSAVANWGKDPRKEENFARSVAELSRALPRMKRLGTTMIRGMSFGLVKGVSPDDAEDGLLSIEPHTETVFHEDGGQSLEEARMESYVAYGRRLMEIVESAGKAAGLSVETDVRSSGAGR